MILEHDDFQYHDFQENTVMICADCCGNQNVNGEHGKHAKHLNKIFPTYPDSIPRSAITYVS